MKRTIFKQLFLLSFLVLTVISLKSLAEKPKTMNWGKLIDLPFDMPEVQLPTFKSDTFNIEKFGAIGDGFTLNSKAINEAIAVCSKQGGGVVLFPNGVWLTGPIVLQSNVNLHLADGALIRFSTNKDLYPLIESYYEGLSSPRCQSPLSGRNLENIAITGRGVIDGGGDAWRQVKREKVTPPHWNRLVKSGGVVENDRLWYPSEGCMKGEQLMRTGKLPGADNRELQLEIKDFFRPVMVSLINCKKVLLDGPTFQNSPAWNIHPLMCEHITINNVYVRNPKYSQNGDGLDLESCRIGSVTNCRFDVGDDAICIKSGKDKQGRDRGMPTELFVIDNNIVYHGHGGFVIGSEMSGGVRNLYVSNCLFIGTDCGLRFKSTRGRGGIVENIWMKNIRMTDIPTEAIRFEMYYGGKSPVEDENGNLIEEPVAVAETTPQFRNLYFDDIYCTNARVAISIRGLAEMPLQNLHMKNVNIKAENGIHCTFAENFTIDGLQLEVEAPSAIELQSSKNIQFTNAEISGFSKNLAVIKGSASKSITLGGKKTPFSKDKIIFKGASEKELKTK